MAGTVMADIRRSIWQDARQIAAIVAITGALATIAWQVSSFALGTVTHQEAQIEHQAIRGEMKIGDEKIDVKASAAADQIKEVGRDVKTIKCLMLAPTVKAKQRCGLE